jgi:hypothetical protein
MDGSIANLPAQLDPLYGAISSGSDDNVLAINRWTWDANDKWTLRSGLDWRLISVDTTEDGLNDGNNGGLYLTAEFTPVKPLILIVSVKGVTDTKQVEAVPKVGFA